MQQVDALRQSGLTWSRINERLGRRGRTLEVMHRRWGRGQLGKGWVQTARTREMIRLAEEERLRPAEIAARMGRSIAAVCVRLAYHGLDAETRALYREAA